MFVTQKQRHDVDHQKRREHKRVVDDGPGGEQEWIRQREKRGDLERRDADRAREEGERLFRGRSNGDAGEFGGRGGCD